MGPRYPYNDEHPAEAYAEKIRAALNAQISPTLQVSRIFRHEEPRLALQPLVKYEI